MVALPAKAVRYPNRQMTQLPFSRLNAIHTGQEFKHYRILEQVGEGGQGCVWSALDKEHDRIVAIKFSETPEAIEKQSVDDVLLEKQVGKLLQLHHPYILPMLDFGAAPKIRYVVSQFIPGGSLQDIILRGPLPPENALQFAAKIAAALDHLHQQEIIHRDLKPGNILLDLRHNIYLSDFGLARVISSKTQVMHTGRGTPFYAPPEQHTLSEATPQSDVYSFGILLYELFTGQLPWNGEKVLGVQQLQTKEELPDPREIIATLPEALNNVLRQATQILPEARPLSAGDVMKMVYAAFKVDPITVASQKNWDEQAIQRLSARQIFQTSVQNWKSLDSTVPLTLTSFAIVETGQSHEELQQAAPQFVLLTAISYGYHHQEWWQRTARIEDRLEVAGHLIRHDQEPVRQRAADLLLEDGQIRGEKFQPDHNFIASVIKGIGLIENTYTRKQLLELLYEITQPEKKWQHTVIGKQQDALLAYQALESSPTGDAAARLIGHLRAEQALQTIFKTASPARRLRTLQMILQTIGNLPASIPAYPRIEAFAEWVLEKAFENPNQLVMLSLLTLIGTAFGFGVHTYTVYRLAAFLDNARLVTAIQHGIFIGFGFAISVPLIRISVERFPKIPAGQRLAFSSLMGALILNITFLLDQTLLLERYEVLNFSAIPQTLLIGLGSWLIAFGIALSGLKENIGYKILTSTAAIFLALAMSWWAHINPALQTFPILYYEYTWPASQVLGLMLVVSIPTAIASSVFSIKSRVFPPAKRPNRPSASSR